MLYGTFCRCETPTQTREDAIRQCSSGEIWGRTPRGGNWLTVQAYARELEGDRGIEFTTDTKPAPNGVLDRNSPLDVRWYYDLTPGVLLREKDGEDFACILADVVNHQL